MEQSSSRNELVCCRCNYTWFPRKQESPARCPSCRSIKWNQPHLKVKCLRCDHEWNSHDGNPSRCPGCGSAKWDQPLTQFTCNKCLHTWLSKGGRPPSHCPECSSREWDRVKVKNIPDHSGAYSSEQMAIIEFYSKEGKNAVQIASITKMPFSVVIDYLKGKTV